MFTHLVTVSQSGQGFHLKLISNPKPSREAIELRAIEHLEHAWRSDAVQLRVMFRQMMKRMERLQQKLQP